MVKRLGLIVIVASFLAMSFNFPSLSLAAEKVKLGSSIKLSPVFYLPVMAAEEKGFWKENGLEVEWVPFAGGTAMFQATVAGALNLGMTDSPSQVLSVARGVPVVAISDLQSAELFVMWVRTDAKFKESKDLKGARCGTPRLGSVAHADCLITAKRLGVDIRPVSVGGIPEILAGLRTGVIDMAAEPTHLMIKLKEQGVIRVLYPMAELVPKPWAGHWVFAARAFTRKEPATVKKLVKATLQATNFLQKNADWSAAKMIEVSKFTPPSSREIFNDYKWATDGKIPAASIENLAKFLAEYGLLAKEKIPPVDEVYTGQFL